MKKAYKVLAVITTFLAVYVIVDEINLLTGSDPENRATDNLINVVFWTGATALFWWLSKRNPKEHSKPARKED